VATKFGLLNNRLPGWSGGGVQAAGSSASSGRNDLTAELSCATAAEARLYAPPR
jgi:hypothetical protein